MYKSAQYLGLSLVVFTSVSAAGIGQKVDVVASSETEFQFQVRIEPRDLNSVSFPDSSVAPYQTVYVGIPYGARVSVLSANASSPEPLDDWIRLPQTAALAMRPLVEVSPPIEVRGRQIVAVNICPVSGSNAFREVTVHLGFSGGRIDGDVAFGESCFDRIFAATLANYDQFRTWPGATRTATRATAVAAGLFAQSAVWYEMAVNRTGIVRVTGAQLEQAGLMLDNVPSSSLRLFNGGGLPVELDNGKPRAQFREVAIKVDDGGDGLFDAEDSFLFFGEPVDRWLYAPGSNPTFVNNPYDDRNIYWLTVSDAAGIGMRISSIDGAPGGGADTVVSTFVRRLHSEQERLLRRFNDRKITDYLNWYWTADATLEFFVSVTGLVTGDTASIFLRGKTFDTLDGNDATGYMNLQVNGVAGLDKWCSRDSCTYRTAALVDGLNRINLRLWPEVNAPPHFDFLELSYLSRTVPVDDELDLPLGAADAVAEIEVDDQFGAVPIVLDISDPLEPVELTGYERAGGLLTFSAMLLPNRHNRFYLAASTQYHAPAAITEARPTDLRTNDNQVDFFIITPRQFDDDLAGYVSYRQRLGLSIEVVTVEDIMDNFGFGLFDPMAIRDFLKYAYENYPQPAPATVLLVGDGNYDFLNHLGTGVANLVPPAIRELDQSASDDNYVYFGDYGIIDSDTSYDTSMVSPDRGFDMLITRWPVRSAAEIRTIVEKTLRYEAPENLGIWRTRFTLVADDEFGQRSNETFHVTDTEKLEKGHIPRLYNRNKVYLWEFPFVNRRKPDVNEAIVNAVNDGQLLVNFVGHGNPDVWAHELVFERNRDVPRLTNRDRLSLFFTASCAIGFFDDPLREGMAEDLLVLPSGGAIGVVSATRLVYASDNAAFNRKVFDVLLYNDSLSIAEAVYAAKLLRQYGLLPYPRPEPNDRAFLLFGDPYLRLGTPELEIEFSDSPASLTALERTRVRGRVRDNQGGLYARDGVLQINVYDSERPKTYRIFNDTGGVALSVDYAVTGPTVYRGSASIDTGFFDFEFIVPLDIGFGGGGAKVVVYALFDSTDGAGLIDSLLIADSVGTLVDATGPEIVYSFSGRADFISGDPVNRTDVLEIALSDSTGINLTAGLGHGITLELDGQSDKAVNLTDRFEYNQDDYTAGQLEYPLNDLSAGPHTFKIKAWDNANNSSTVEFRAVVQAAERLTISELLNYPNPMKDSTRFSAFLSEAVARFRLEIFTLSGRKIKSFGPYNPPAGYFDDIVWNGRDDTGDRVATGVYIYKASAVPATGGDQVESFGKVVVVN